ncbi:MAG: DUF5808 domain-containing protein [Propionibacteriaceae bacterium]|nr:DUF5808 domain-containing protein [Propionibacteriaceae bacterium]
MPELIFALASLATVVLVFVALPEMSRPTVPLGVSVPSGRVADPVVRAAIRSFRIQVLGAGAVAAILTVATAHLPGVSALVLLGYVAWAMISFALCRRPILEAKAAENWYEGVHVDEGTAQPLPEQAARPRWFLLLLALAVSLAALAVVLIDSSTVSTTGLTGLGLSVGMTTLSVLTSHRRDPHPPDGKPQAAQRFEVARARSLQRTLGWAALVAALTLGVATVAPVIRLNPAALAWSLWALFLASLIPMIWLVFDVAAQQRASRAVAEVPGPESPDDDRFWKWGLFYINHDDPRMFVPKRSGVGYDSNLGHPVGMAMMCGVLLLVLGTVVAVVSLL